MDFVTVAPHLKTAVDYIHSKKTIPATNIKAPTLDKLDCTLDIAGSFYAPGDWKTKYQEVKQNLEDVFDMKFRDNGNSMDTCFQFVSEDDSEGLTIRVKVYWKTLAYI